MNTLLNIVSLGGLLSVYGKTKPTPYVIANVICYGTALLLWQDGSLDGVEQAEGPTLGILSVLFALYVSWCTTIRRLRDVGGMPKLFGWVGIFFLPFVLVASPALILTLGGIPSRVNED